MISIDLSVIIPVYSQEKNLNLIMNELNNVAIIKGISMEVLIANATNFPIEEFINLENFQNLHPIVLNFKQKPRLGQLIRICTSYSEGDFILTLTGEGVNNRELIEKLYEKLISGSKLIVVERDLQNSKDLIFKIYQKLYRFILKIILNQKISDSTNGFRAFDRKFFLALGVNRPGLAFFTEMSIKYCEIGGRIDYVQLKKVRDESESRLVNLELPEKFNFFKEFGGYLFVISSLIYRKMVK